MSKTRKTKKNAELTPVTQRDKSFELKLALPNIPTSLAEKGSREALDFAKKVAKEALFELSDRKKRVIDPIAKGLTELRKEFKAACEPWEALQNRIREVLLAEEKRLSEEAAKAAQRALPRKVAPEIRAELKADAISQASHDRHLDVEGTQIRRTWKARIVSQNDVPVSFNGIVLRPIDESLLNKLAKNPATRLEIPGVEWFEEKSVALT